MNAAGEGEYPLLLKLRRRKRRNHNMSEDQLRLLGERYYTIDLNGSRVLYGLTLEETSEYEELLRADLHRAARAPTQRPRS